MNTTIRYPRLAHLFHNAQQNGLKWPQAFFRVENDTFGIYMVRTRDGNILVRDQRKRDGHTRFGIINGQDGTWQPDSWNRYKAYGRFVQDHWDGILEIVTGVLERFESDPAGFADLYGQRTGNCMFCMRELSAEDSLAAGYGPICAERYGLPHAGLAAKARDARLQEEAVDDCDDFDVEPAIEGSEHHTATIPGANVTDVQKAQVNKAMAAAPPAFRLKLAKQIDAVADAPKLEKPAKPAWHDVASAFGDYYNNARRFTHAAPTPAAIMDAIDNAKHRLREDLLALGIDPDSIADWSDK